MRNIVSIAVIAFMLVAVAALACAPGPGPTPAPATGPVRTAPASTKPAWEREWEDTLSAARKEGEITVYTTYGPDWRVAMNEAMSKKYGIAFSVLSGRSDEILARILKEQQARVYQADAMQAIPGNRYYNEAEQWEAVFQHLEKMLVLPEVTDPGAWVGGKIPWVDPDRKTLIFWRDYLSVPVIINTNLVSAQDLKTWDDLLNPKWKGKIILSDPTLAGASNTVMTMLASSIKDWDFVNRLLAQEPSVQRDYRLMTEWIAQGKYAIMIGPRKEEAQSFINAGAPVRYVNFEDGLITTFGAGTIAVLKGNPHPNATRIFLNFLLSKEGQTVTAKVGGFPSARVDVPTDFLDPATLRKPGMKSFSDASKEHLQQFSATNRRLREVMQPLLK
ncbi:MAG: extracellular solute-binding protein [Chloroflexi bacterium]|nr:extracellular solute-binding protein [Chloroflexota bacterium]